MLNTKYQKNSAGISLIEVVVVSALILIIFGGLFASFDFSLKLIAESRAKLSAISLANERMEYFRSLPYNDVGTLFDIPPGIIPQNSTTTLNGIEFSERVKIDYVDDPGDGLMTATTTDSNNISSDYKRIRLEYKWNFSNQTGEIFMISYIVPPSIETDIGGGTVRINVFGPDVLPLQGASVRIVNNLLSPSIDTVRISDVSGVVLFSGAPAGSEYEVTVTGPIGGNQYSTTGTVLPSVVNQPSSPPFSVVEAGISTLNYQIGALSDLAIVLNSSMSEGEFLDDFSILVTASSSDVEVSAGTLTLENTLGVYDNSGFAYLGPITPVTIDRWSTLRIAGDRPANTDYRLRFYTSPSVAVYTLVPDSELPGNSAGFSGTIVDISAMDSSFPSVYLGITLTTSDTAVAPVIDEVAVYYRESAIPLSSYAFSVRGNKVLGTMNDSSPVYKFASTTTSNGSGEVSFPDLEFDNYTFTFPGRNITSLCRAYPIVQTAGVDGEAEFLLGGAAADYLRAVVRDSSGRPVPGASVRLRRAGFAYDETRSTDTCGNAYFGTGLTTDPDYTLDITATGYTSISLTNIFLGGGLVDDYVLTP